VLARLAAGGGGPDYLKKIKAPILLVTQPDDLVFHADGVRQMVDGVKAAGGKIDHVMLSGSRGHLDGVLSMKQAEAKIAEFLGQP